MPGEPDSEVLGSVDLCSTGEIDGAMLDPDGHVACSACKTLF